MKFDASVDIARRTRPPDAEAGWTLMLLGAETQDADWSGDLAPGGMKRRGTAAQCFSPPQSWLLD